MEDLVLVNFITHRKKGLGPEHRELMRREYATYLHELKIKTTPFFSMRERVLTVVYKRRRFRKLAGNDLKFMFLELVKYCKTKGIKNLYIPFYLLVIEGFTREFLSMLVDVVFEGSGIKVKVK
jgi:hypothetical protein